MPARLHQTQKLLSDGSYPTLIQRAVILRQHTCADFDDNGLRACGDLLAGRINHGPRLTISFGWLNGSIKLAEAPGSRRPGLYLSLYPETGACVVLPNGHGGTPDPAIFLRL